MERAMKIIIPSSRYHSLTHFNAMHFCNIQQIGLHVCVRKNDNTKFYNYRVILDTLRR